MKTLLFIALLSASVLAGDTQDPFALLLPKRVALEWHFVDETRVWLSANYYGSEFAKEGYHPSFTYLMSKYKPTIVKQKDGQYVITFSSEIVQDVP